MPPRLYFGKPLLVALVARAFALVAGAVVAVAAGSNIDAAQRAQVALRVVAATAYLTMDTLILVRKSHAFGLLFVGWP